MIEEFTKACLNYDPELIEQIDWERASADVKSFIRSLPIEYFLLFYFALFLFQWGIFPLVPKIRPFSLLNQEEKIRYIMSWQQSPLYIKRIIFKVLSSFCLVNSFSQEHILRRLGFSRSLEYRRGEK